MLNWAPSVAGRSTTIAAADSITTDNTSRKKRQTTTATEQESLTELLALVDQLFGQHGREGHCRYRLGRTRTGWQFDVADDASRWASLGLKWRFRGKTPQRAIRAFLDYTQEHGIRVAELAAAG